MQFISYLIIGVSVLIIVGLAYLGISLSNESRLFFRRQEYRFFLWVRPKIWPFVKWTIVILLIYAFIQWAYTQPSFGFSPISSTDHSKTVWDWIGQISLSAGGAIIAILYTEGQKRRDLQNRRFSVLDSFRKEMKALQGSDSDTNYSDKTRFYMRELVLGTLIQLDIQGKETVFMFLCTSGLIKASNPVINIAGADFSWINIAKYTNGLDDTYLDGVTLIGATLKRVRLTDCSLRNAKLWYANVRGVTFSNTPVAHVEISQDQLRQATITN